MESMSICTHMTNNIPQYAIVCRDPISYCFSCLIPLSTSLVVVDSKFVPSVVHKIDFGCVMCIVYCIPTLPTCFVRATGVAKAL